MESEEGAGLVHRSPMRMEEPREWTERKLVSALDLAGPDQPQDTESLAQPATSLPTDPQSLKAHAEALSRVEGPGGPH